MHSKELRTAATKGDTKTAVALLARGADVHYKGDKEYSSSGLHPRVVGFSWCGADGPSIRGRAAGVAILAVQVDGPALCVV